MITEDGRAYTGWAKVRWDAYKGPRSEIPAGYVQELPFQRLEPEKK